MNPNFYDGSTDEIDITNSTYVANQLYHLANVDNLQQLHDNQERLIQSDRYYIAKYKAQNYILQQIVFFCCLGLIGAILYNKQWISLTMFNVYLLLLFIVLLFYIGRGLFDIFIRDSHNFDEYDYSMLNNPNMNGLDKKNNGTADFELSGIPSCHI